MRQIKGQMDIYDFIPKKEFIPCDSCGYDCIGTCMNPTESSDDYCIMGSKWKPREDTIVWSVSGLKLTQMTVVSIDSTVAEHYFTCKEKDGSIHHLSSGAKGEWWDISKEAAKKCKFYEINGG